MIDPNQTLSEFLEIESVKRGLTPFQFAREVRISHKTLQKMEFTKPKNTVYKKLADYLDVDIVQLFKLPINKDE